MNNDIMEEKKKEENYSMMEKNIYGLFSNLEEDYEHILKDIHKKNNQRKSFNYPEPRIYKISNDVINKRNNSLTYRENVKKPIANLISEKKKKGYLEVAEYPFKNVVIKKKEEYNIEDSIKKNKNDISNNNLNNENREDNKENNNDLNEENILKIL